MSRVCTHVQGLFENMGFGTSMDNMGYLLGREKAPWFSVRGFSLLFILLRYFVGLCRVRRELVLFVCVWDEVKKRIPGDIGGRDICRFFFFFFLFTQ